MGEEGNIMGVPKSMRLPDRCKTEVCGCCLGVTWLQPFGYGASVGGGAGAAGHIRYICIANARDTDSATGHRLMQCKKGLENSKSNYYSSAAEVRRRV